MWQRLSSFAMWNNYLLQYNQIFYDIHITSAPKKYLNANITKCVSFKNISIFPVNKPSLGYINEIFNGYYYDVYLLDCGLQALPLVR